MDMKIVIGMSVRSVCMDSGGMSTGLLASVWRAGVRAHGGGDQTIFLGFCYGSTMLPWRLHPVQQNTQMAALSLSLSLSLKQSSQLLIPDRQIIKAGLRVGLEKPSRYRHAFDSACRQLFFDRREQAYSSPVFSRNCKGNTARLFTQKSIL